MKIMSLEEEKILQKKMNKRGSNVGILIRGNNKIVIKCYWQISGQPYYFVVLLSQEKK
jgi:hypothetical protein